MARRIGIIHLRNNGGDHRDERTHPHFRRSQKQGQAADGVRRMAGRAKSGHLHCGEVLRRSWRPDDVGRILRTFKIKKNVEVTDNGKDNF